MRRHGLLYSQKKKGNRIGRSMRHEPNSHKYKTDAKPTPKSVWEAGGDAKEIFGA